MASLDMSLDDMIKSSRKSNRRGGRGQGQAPSQGRPPRGRGQGVPARGGRPFGAPRRNPLGINARPSASTIAKSVRRTRRTFWQNDLFEDSLKAAGLSGVETGTKLYVSNLDVGVTNEDIRELFTEFGELIRYAIHYDRNGRPSGSAELIFARRSDAFQALKRYNNVQLDGKPMKIEIIGSNSDIPLSARVNVVGGANGKRRTVVMASGPGRSRGGFTAGSGFAAGNRGFGSRAARGGSNTGRGGGRGRGRGRGGAGGRGGRGGETQRWRKKAVEKSADELDKELETYHAEAMQT